MPETGEEKFLLALEAESRSLLSDLEVIKEQLQTLPSRTAKVELESQLEDVIKQIKISEFKPNSPGEIEALSFLAERLSDYLAAEQQTIVSSYIKKRIETILEKIDALQKMVLANQEKPRNPLTDKRKWK